MSLQWVDKYKPRNLNEVIGNKEIINKIDKWIKVFNNDDLIYKDFRNAILLSGPPGIGKTTIAHLIYNKYKFDIIEFNASEIRTSKIISEKLHNILSGKSIKTMFQENIRTGVIMDEIDGIESRKESNTSDIIKYINYKTDNFKKKNKHNKKIPNLRNIVKVNQNPIICICNKINKNVTPLLKEVMHIKFQKPNDTYVHKLIKKINTAEKLEIPETYINLIVPYCQNDFRRTIYVLEYLNKIKYKLNKNPETFLKSLENIGYKEIDIGIYDAVNSVLFSKNLKMSESLDYYYADQNFVPYLIFENFLRFIDKNLKLNYADKLTLAINYYDFFIDSQKLRAKLFGNWNFNNYIGILTCFSANLMIKDIKFKNNFSKFEKSSLISKYNYRYYNLKSINIISKKIGIELGEFQFFAYIILYSLFIYTPIQKPYMIKCKNNNITFKEYEKTMKLCYLYPNYSHLYTKKFQKKIINLYEKI